MRVDKDEPGFTYTGLTSELNVENCKRYCKDHGFTSKMVGLHVMECHCNMYFKDSGKRPEEYCWMKCPGNVEELCGGVGYISGYPA